MKQGDWGHSLHSYMVFYNRSWCSQKVSTYDAPLQEFFRGASEQIIAWLKCLTLNVTLSFSLESRWMQNAGRGFFVAPIKISSNVISAVGVEWCKPFITVQHARFCFTERSCFKYLSIILLGMRATLKHIRTQLANGFIAYIWWKTFTPFSIWIRWKS